MPIPLVTATFQPALPEGAERTAGCPSEGDESFEDVLADMLGTDSALSDMNPDVLAALPDAVPAPLPLLPDTSGGETVAEPEAAPVLSDAQFAAFLSGRREADPSPSLAQEQPEVNPHPSPLAAFLFQAGEMVSERAHHVSETVPDHADRALDPVEETVVIPPKVSDESALPRTPSWTQPTEPDIATPPMLSHAVPAITRLASASYGGAPQDNPAAAEGQSRRSTTETNPLESSKGLSSTHSSTADFLSKSDAPTLPDQPALPASHAASDASRSCHNTMTAEQPVARHAAHQVAVAITSAAGQATELCLDPEELGRVRVSLHTSEAAIAVVIQAERPETADLMRRHIDQLAQEFRSLGYQDVSFSFGRGQERSGAYAQPPPESTEQAAPATADVSPALHRQRPVPAGHLDLRI